MDFMVIHSSRPVSIVPGWFLCFFSSRFQVGLSWFQVVFLVIQGFSLVVHGFMLVFIFFQGSRSVFHGFSRFQVNFSWFKVVFHGFFMVPGLVFMIPGGFYRH